MADPAALPPIKVLSIDGGGIRGIIPAAVLAYLEGQKGKGIAEIFDLIVGTSTGGILALGLTVPNPNIQGKPNYSAQSALSLYQNQGKDIFPSDFFQRLHNALNFVEPRYPSAGIETVLKNYFGISRLKEAVTDVLVTSYDIENQRPFFFKSRRAKSSPQFDYLMAEAARATSAAPTYFAPAKVQTQFPPYYFGLVDGGIAAGNPALCAYAEAISLYPGRSILLVSLGTGNRKRPVHYNEAVGWGLVQWARPIFGMVMGAGADTIEYQLTQLSQAGLLQYFRFECDLNIASDEMDDASDENIHALNDEAAMLLANNAAALGQLLPLL